MERFLNIDWNPPLEDMLKSTFIDQERLEKESVVHRILTSNFSDPFVGIEDDYKNVKMHLIQDKSEALDEEDTEDDVKSTKTEKGIQLTEQKKRTYVPGIVKPIFKFPRMSNLNKEQQALCLRVLLRFSESDKPKITQTQREELQSYMDLQNIISLEQEEFLAFASSKWNERTLTITCEDYINLCWKLKLQYLHKLSKYYAEVTNIPFVADKNIEVKFINDCLQMGQLQNIVLPTLTKRYTLYINSEQLQQRFLPENRIDSESAILYKLPVSKDPNCQTLAENNNVDIVISSSGLNCLVNNIGSNYSNSWMLPVVIKKHNDKNVIYIDKQAPPVASTIPEKNTWVYKHILRYCFTAAKGFTSKRNTTEYMFDDSNCEGLLKLEAEHDALFTNNESHSTSDDIKKTSKQQDLKDDVDSIENVASNLKKSPHISDSNISEPTTIEPVDDSNISDSEYKGFELNGEDNVSYKLFSIGPQSSEQNELMKNVIKEYKMLVRTKTDGYETLQKNLQRLLLLAPKLEHQVDFGAEAVTLEEALKQWISLVFRPHTFLARIRISAQTSEILQMEYRTAMSINNEIKRLYNVKAEDSLTIFHNVIQYLSNLSPGRYIMRHTERNGAFATVYKEVENPGKSNFDIHAIYGEQFHTLNSSWIQLDKIIATPAQKVFERMPAMFYPPNKQKLSKNKKSAKAKTNTGAVRRSLRNQTKK